MVYRGDKTPEYAATGEGLALFDGVRYAYQYNLTDHLGDVRTVVDTSGSVVQSTDYYPFGLAHATSSLDKNKYLYNGKELQSEVLGGTSFGMLDYGARFYDPVVARWHSVDPLAEKSSRWSTYNYAYDNPMRFIDPDGKEPQIGGPSGGKSSGGGESGGLAAVAKAIGSFFGLDNVTRQTPAERIEYADRRASLEVVKDDMERVGNGIWAPVEAVVPGGTVLSKMVKREEVTVEDVGIEAAFLFLPGVGKGVSKTIPKVGRPLVSMTEETFSQALFKGVENMAEYSIYGTKGMVGKTFNRNIFLIETSNKGLSGLRSLVGNMEAEALGAGANQISIYGSSVINKGFLNPNIAKRFGYSFEQSGSGIILQKAIK